MLVVAKLFALLNRALFMGTFEFRAVGRGSLAPSGWDFAHHEVEGRNGGMLMIPRWDGILWPMFLGRRFRLAARRRPGRR